VRGSADPGSLGENPIEDLAKIQAGRDRPRCGDERLQLRTAPNRSRVQSRVLNGDGSLSDK
jgi:hypothetical protein